VAGDYMESRGRLQCPRNTRCCTAREWRKEREEHRRGGPFEGLLSIDDDLESMTKTPGSELDWLIEYFHDSAFQYLALDHGGASIRLSREAASQGETREPAVTPVRASSVGFVTLANGRRRIPKPGERIAQGEPILAIRRYKQIIDVTAPAAGSLASIAVEGAFVEFGEMLATITPSLITHHPSLLKAGN